MFSGKTWNRIHSFSSIFVRCLDFLNVFPHFFGSLDIKFEKEWKIRYKTWISFGDFFRHFRGSISLFYEFLVKIIGKWVSLVEKTKWKRFIFWFHWFLLDLSRDYEKYWVPIFRNQRGTPLQKSMNFFIIKYFCVILLGILNQ